MELCANVTTDCTSAKVPMLLLHCELKMKLFTRVRVCNEHAL